MYYIAVYDVEEERVAKALKICRKYLNWVQNSVFEGNLTEAQFARLKAEIRETLDLHKDFFIFYSVADPKWLDREILGPPKNSTDNFV